jgi:hypothetical protein
VEEVKSSWIRAKTFSWSREPATRRGCGWERAWQGEGEEFWFEGEEMEMRDSSDNEGWTPTTHRD